MAPEEQRRKLAQIASLSADELDGWEAEAKRRGYFDGEEAAILRRRNAVGAK